MTRASTLRCRISPRLDTLEDRTLLATCTVTNLLDVGRGAMSIGSGQITGDLRFCIKLANATAEQDVIDFTVTGTIPLKRSLPWIDSDLIIAGPGRDLLTIDAQKKSRVFYVEEGITVDIANLTVTGGQAREGAGIYNEGSLRLQNCSINGNTAAIVPPDPWAPKSGGGIYNDGFLFMDSCTVSDNYIPATVMLSGAGIYNGAEGTLIVHRSLISGNHTGYSLSSAGFGGGVYNRGEATIVNTTITNNKLNEAGKVSLEGWGGGLYNHLGTLTVDSSLISNNVASGDYYGYGGGIANGSVYHDGGLVMIKNSTIVGNLAYAQGDHYGFSAGGGISNGHGNSSHGGTVLISHSTIAHNITDGLEEYVTGHGGGIVNESPGIIDMHHTIVAGNAARTAGPDVSGQLVSSGYNLFENSAQGSGYSATDILDVDPLLGPLADNGGPTLTMALLPGSPAIDAGDPIIEDTPEFDQRGPGFPRIVNDMIDIGAFEVQATGAPKISRINSVPPADILSVVLATADLEALEE